MSFHVLQPVLHTGEDLGGDGLPEFRVQDLLLVIRIAEECHFHQTVRVFGRTTQGEIETAHIAELLQFQLKHPLQHGL